MTFKSVLRNLAAVIPIGFGIFVFLFWAILELIFEGLILDHFVLFSFMVLLPIALGVFGLYKAAVLNKEENEENLEIIVIKIAAKQGGRITVAEVSMKAQVSSAKAENVLQKLYERNAVEVLVSPNGSLVYALTNYSSEKEKRTASSVL